MIYGLQTVAGRGGPFPTLTHRSVYPTGRVIVSPAAADKPCSMPPCPICEGSGERMMATDAGLETRCPMCLGSGKVPRLLYRRIVLDLAVLSLDPE